MNKTIKIFVLILIVGMVLTKGAHFYLKSDNYALPNQKILDIAISRIKETKPIPQNFINAYQRVHPITNGDGLFLDKLLQNNHRDCPCFNISLSLSFKTLNRFISSWKLEKQLTQKECLNYYAFNYYYINDIRGIDKASLYYFHQKLDDLNNEDMETLVKMMSNEPLYRPQIKDSYYGFMYHPNENNAYVDFKNSPEQLIKSVAIQTKRNSCENDSIINGVFKYDDFFLNLPVKIKKYCFPTLGHPMNVIDIAVNQNNAVLLGNRFLLDSLTSISQGIKNATNDKLQFAKANEIVYNLNWSPSDHQLLEKRLLEALEGMKEISDSISMKIFNIHVGELNQEQITELRTIYKPIIQISEPNIIDIPE